MGDSQEFLQRAFKPLFIRLKAPKLIQADVHYGTAAEGYEDPSIQKYETRQIQIQNVSGVPSPGRLASAF